MILILLKNLAFYDRITKRYAFLTIFFKKGDESFMKPTTKSKKPPYGVFQNTAFVTKLLWKWDKPIIFLILANIPTILFLPLCTVYLPKVIVQAIETQAGASSLIFSVLALGIAYLFLNLLNSFIQVRMDFHILRVGQFLSIAVNKKSMDTDYENIGNPRIQILTQKSLEIIDGESERGLQSLVIIFFTIFSNLLGFSVYTGILSKLSPLVSILIILSAFIYHFVNIRINHWIYKNKDNWLKLDRKLSYLGYKSSSFDVAKDIRLYNMRSWFYGTFKKFMDERIRWTITMQLLYYLSGAVGALLTLLRDAGAYAYLIYLVWKGSISVSDFILYFGIISGFSNWCIQIIYNFSKITQANYDICDLREYLNIKDTTNRGKGIPLPAKDELPCKIELHQVHYHYHEDKKDIIRNINLTIQPGEKIAVVGANGAGKTTLVKLICGLYSPTSGEIKINGNKIEAYNRDDYFKLFSPVFQDVQFLPISIKKNITLCEENEIDKDKLNRCLMLSGFDQVIEKLPHGLDTILVSDLTDKGIQLSGGEQQKLLLARALYKNAPIMILDEPTAALDPIAENAMYLKYHELTKDATSIFISHRLASTRFCDRIIFMNQGEIVEIGSHEELLKAGGKYREMFDIQAKYYKEKEGGEENE